MYKYEIVDILETIKNAILSNEFVVDEINGEKLSENMFIVDSTYMKNVLYEIARDYGYIMKK